VLTVFKMGRRGDRGVWELFDVCHRS